MKTILESPQRILVVCRCGLVPAHHEISRVLFHNVSGRGKNFIQVL